MNSRLLSGSNLVLAALALLSPFSVVSPAQASTNGETASLECKMGSRNTVITNTGSAVVAAGTRIIVRYYPAPEAGGSMSQKIMYLSADLGPGASTTFAGEAFGLYNSCTARLRT